MKWSEFRREAEKRGFMLVRHGASHDLYVHRQTGQPLCAERHGSQEIRKGLLKSLLKQLEAYK